MLKLKRYPPGSPFFSYKKPSGFMLISDKGDIDSETMEFDDMYYKLIDVIDSINNLGYAKFLTAYGKNKRVKKGENVEFYFIMDGEPGYDNDEYELVFIDTFQSLKQAIQEFEEDAKKYL